MPAESRLQITPEGAALLRRQIAQLQARAPREDLVNVSSERDEDRESALEDVRVQLQEVRRRVRELLRVLNTADVVVTGEQSEEVAIGSTVLVSVENEEEPRRYIIGGHGETRPKLGLIAYSSPFAQDLMGLTVGSTFNINSGGQLELATVASILPPSQGYKPLHARWASAEGEGEEL